MRPSGGAGQLLSSTVISHCVHALELPNGLVRRLLDAPLKQALLSKEYVVRRGCGCGRACMCLSEIVCLCVLK